MIRFGTISDLRRIREASEYRAKRNESYGERGTELATKKSAKYEIVNEEFWRQKNRKCGLQRRQKLPVT